MNMARDFRLPFGWLDWLLIAAPLAAVAAFGLAARLGPGLLVLGFACIVFTGLFVNSSWGRLEAGETGFQLRRRLPAPEFRRRQMPALCEDLELPPARFQVARRGDRFRFSSLDRDVTLRLGSQADALEQSLRAMGYGFQD